MGPDGTPPDDNDIQLPRNHHPPRRPNASPCSARSRNPKRRREPIRSPASGTAAASKTGYTSSARDATPYALAYGDLDHFKILNDTHGHEAGDQALRLFARVLRDSVRPDDITARYGGEEFVIVLPDCTAETATKVLERLREQLALTLTSGRVPAFTVSFGVASSTDADTFDEVVAIADHALLTAKANGRNRTVRAAHLDIRQPDSLTHGPAESRPA